MTSISWPEIACGHPPHHQFFVCGVVTSSLINRSGKLLGFVSLIVSLWLVLIHMDFVSEFFFGPTQLLGSFTHYTLRT